MTSPAFRSRPSRPICQTRNGSVPSSGTNALCRKAVEIVFPLLGGNIGRVFSTTLQHRRTAIDVYNVDVSKMLDTLIGSVAMDPDIIWNVGKRDEPVASHSKGCTLRDCLFRVADPSLVRLHQFADIGSELIASFPANREVTYFSPILVVSKAPVTNHFGIEASGRCLRGTKPRCIGTALAIWCKHRCPPHCIAMGRRRRARVPASGAGLSRVMSSLPSLSCGFAGGS